MALQEACNDLRIADESRGPVSSSLGVEDGLQDWKQPCAVLLRHVKVSIGQWILAVDWI